MLLSGISANAGHEMPRLIATARRHPYIEEWFDAARNWDTLGRKERQRILDELGERLHGVQLFTLVVNDESVHKGAKLASEYAKDFDIPINARVDRATRCPAYAEAWLENPAALPTDQRAALYTLWLLDDPPARANLRRCPDCQVLFWADVVGGTRKYKYCERHRP